MAEDERLIGGTTIIDMSTRAIIVEAIFYYL